MATYHRHPAYSSQFDHQHMPFGHQYMAQPWSRHEADNDFLFNDEPRYNAHHYNRHAEGTNNYDDYEGSQHWHNTSPSNYVAMGEEDEEDSSSYSASPTTVHGHQGSRHSSSSDFEFSLSMIRPTAHTSTIGAEARSLALPPTNWPNSAANGSSRRRYSSDSDDSPTRPSCPHPDCLGPTGQPSRFFSRKADVTRHHRSMHERCFIDCPRRRCGRKGDRGFTRNDHLKEHMRNYHQMDLPRRTGQQ